MLAPHGLKLGRTAAGITIVHASKTYPEIHIRFIRWSEVMIDARTLTVLGMSAALALAGCEIDDADAEPEPSGDLPAPVIEAAGSEALPFAPGLVPAHGDVTSIVPGPGGEVVYLAMSGEPDRLSRLWEARWDEEAEHYTEPTPLPFSRLGDTDRDPALAPSGSHLIFSSARPGLAEPAGGFNLWVTEWQDPESEAGDDPEPGWSDPAPIPLINSPVWEGGPTLASSGSLYFASNREAPSPGKNLFVSELENGMWVAGDPLEPPVNSSADETDPWVSPDESFLLFASDRDGVFDIYVSFRSEVGGWLPPLPLGSEVNTSANETAPTMSETGEFLFFHREGEGILWIPVEHAELEQPDETADLEDGG